MNCVSTLSIRFPWTQSFVFKEMCVTNMSALQILGKGELKRYDPLVTNSVLTNSCVRFRVCNFN